MEHTKVQNEIIKDGKVYKHFDTRPSQTGTPGYLTDIYRSEDGSIQYVERLTNAIRFSKHSRFTSEGNMISFAVNFKVLMQSVLQDCSDDELDRSILKCYHPLSKAKDLFLKEEANGGNTFSDALNEKIDEVVAELNDGNVVNALERVMAAKRAQENPFFHNAIALKAHYLKEEENQPELN